jgi:hypothetical protein
MPSVFTPCDVENEARDVFTHEQLCAIIGAASSEWKTAILLAYNGGLRLATRWASHGKTSVLSGTRFVSFRRKLPALGATPINYFEPR